SINYPIGSETFEHDGRGNVTKITNALGKATTIAYNALFKVLSVTDALGNAITYAYDANGNAISETWPSGAAKTFTYDALNRLTAVTWGGDATTYNYDDFGNLASITDANGNTTSYEYDTRGLLITETDELGNAFSYTYDGNYNVLSKTDANGDVTTYTYDALDRILSRTYLENTDLFTYDQMGNLVNASNDDISISYTYDGRNRLLSKTVGTWGKTVNYAYNNAGNRISMTDPSGSITTYIYDGNNRLTSLTNNLGTTTFTLDAAGRVIQQNNPNGTYSTYNYNDAGQWTGASHFNAANAMLSSYVYTYDDHGNRLNMTDHNGVVRQHFYDEFSRLDSVNYGNGNTETFDFDDAGNRIMRRENGVPETYTYNVANHLQSVSSFNYIFDDNGNMTGKIESGDTLLYVYDSQNRLVEINHPGGGQQTYKYDPFGNRISATDTAGDQTRFFYDHANILLELDESANTLAKYASGLSPDSWLSMQRGGSSYFYHKDGLGSIVQLSNSSGAVAQSYAYNAFGEITSQTGSVENPFAFAGRELDSESGLQNHRTRNYDPSTGRFTSEDNFFGVLRRPATLNKYLYAENNPASYVDNNGQIAFIPILWYAGAALVGAVAGWGAGSAINSQRDFHTKRNWHNRTPTSSPPGPEWEKQPDWKNAFHQPDNVTEDNPYPNKKYLLPDENGGSSEAILQPDGTYLNTGPKQGTYNYYNPDGFWSSTGHFLW
ncbi:MAG: RHS repeat-associated core domain-containing protein, partial [Bacteroidota bacterium]